jgi:3,4-dihydroxy-2-butanone 4-phosphate synthase
VHIKAVDAQHEDKDFTFDHCYGSDSLQTKVYADLGQPIVLQALDGFNGTIFAYGQTGSGKSFSMMGDAESKGIIPQLNEDLFEKLALKLEQMEAAALQQDSNAKTKFMVTVSFLEVYNEDIKDLLNPSDKKLKIHENPKLGIYVEDLCELVSYFLTVVILPVRSGLSCCTVKQCTAPPCAQCQQAMLSFRHIQRRQILLLLLTLLSLLTICHLCVSQIVRDSSDLMRLIYQGNAVRRVAATKMNDQSSRSHSVFTIKVEQKTVTELVGGVTREQTVKAKVNLVDLAGSERAAKTGASGATLKEGANINLSLMALGNVINMLSEGAAR